MSLGPRFQSIGHEARPQPLQQHSNAGVLLQESATGWVVYVTIDKDRYRIGCWPEQQARSVFTYATRHTALAREVARRLYLEGEDEPLERFIAGALAAGAKIQRYAKVEAVVYVAMEGSDEDIIKYMNDKFQYAVRIKKVESVRVIEG